MVLGSIAAQLLLGVSDPKQLEEHKLLDFCGFDISGSAANPITKDDLDDIACPPGTEMR